MKRKIIGCLTCRPESVYQKRVLDGLMAQCERYGYDMAVFCPLVDITHYEEGYLESELNILNLIQYDRFDAIIVSSLPFVANGDFPYLNRICDDIKARCHKPVVVMDMPMGDFECVVTDDISAIAEMTRHVINVHGCKKTYFLTGTKGNEISEMRINGYKQGLESCGLPFSTDNVFYGDFWYPSGEQLAERIASGELEMPEAVICASDHMAIGVSNQLSKLGIQVPEQIIVTGFDASEDAALNENNVTSYTPEISRMAEMTINRVREIIEPGAEILPTRKVGEDSLVIGTTCGCKEDTKRLKKMLESNLYKFNHNFNDSTTINYNQDIGLLVESYMLEYLTQSKSPLECLKRAYNQTYLFRPFTHFYLCLRENWLDTEVTLTKGYPEQMRCVIHAIPDNIPEYSPTAIHCRNDDRDIFDTKNMLPELFNEHDEPFIFYFSPVHFQTDTLGYAILQCKMKDRIRPTTVYRNWMRNVTNALEMARVQSSLISSALIDSMTKLYNRRGMDLKLNDMISIAEPDQSYLAMVIDMDGLKTINDTYGHNEGDYGISTISSVTRCITEGNEIAVRAGGDEFYILGVGYYDDVSAVEKRIARFYEILDSQNVASIKPYKVYASVGYCVKRMDEVHGINEVISVADENMYTNKIERKANRKK